jgi:hypothetical protein
MSEYPRLGRNGRSLLLPYRLPFDSAREHLGGVTVLEAEL